MSLHKARPNAGNPDPTQPGSTVMQNGRYPVPHAEVDGKPILGGIQNAIVPGQTRTEEEDAAERQAYDENRKAMQESQDESFDNNTGEPKTEKVVLEPDPVGDASGQGTAPFEEVKRNVEVEKKVDNVIEKKPDVKPVGPHNPKVDKDKK